MFLTSDETVFEETTSFFLPENEVIWILPGSTPTLTCILLKFFLTVPRGPLTERTLPSTEARDAVGEVDDRGLPDP